jgi:hypothetical protein
MPAPMTELQERFAVEYVLNGGGATAAAIAAGYSEKSAGDLDRRTLALPHVQAAIEIELWRQLRGELAPLAFSFLRQVFVNEGDKFSERVRADVAKIVVDRAGFVPPRQAADRQADDKTPDQMSTQELHDLADELDSQIQSRAKVIEQLSEPIDPAVADLV